MNLQRFREIRQELSWLFYTIVALGLVVVLGLVGLRSGGEVTSDGWHRFDRVTTRELLVTDESGDGVALIGTTADGKAQIILGAEDEPQFLMTVERDGPRLLVDKPDGGVGIIFGTNRKGGVLHLCGENGSRLTLAVDERDSGAVMVAGTDAEPFAYIGLNDDDRPAVITVSDGQPIALSGRP